MKPSVRSRLFLEVLEERAVPTVSAVVDVDGNLNITGAPDGPLVLTLTADETYTLTDNGAATPILATPASGNVVFDLDFAGTGNDDIAINFGGNSMGGDLIVDAGTGSDTVSLNGAGAIPGNIRYSNVNEAIFPGNKTYGGDILVDTEAESEDDFIRINQNSIIPGTVTLLTGNGEDEIVLRSFLIEGDVNIDTGSGDDDIIMNGGVTILGDVIALTGNGDDVITLTNADLHFLGVDAGFGFDELVLAGDTVIFGNLYTYGINFLEVPSTTMIGGTVGVDSAGESEASDFDFNGTVVGGNIYIYTGNFSNRVRIRGNTTVGGEVGVNLGNSLVGPGNIFRLTPAASIARNLTVLGGSGTDSVFLNGTIGGSTRLRLGTGTNTVEADGIIEGNFEFIGLGGTDSATLSGVIGGNLSFNLGGGNNTVDMTMISDGGRIMYLGGSGVDSVTFDGDASRAQLYAFLQGGNDEFTLGTMASLGFLYVDFGSGIDTFTNMLGFIPFRKYLRNLP